MISLEAAETSGSCMDFEAVLTAENPTWHRSSLRMKRLQEQHRKPCHHNAPSANPLDNVQGANSV